jgi:hypothetical protein
MQTQSIRSPRDKQTGGGEAPLQIALRRCEGFHIAFETPTAAPAFSKVTQVKDSRVPRPTNSACSRKNLREIKR